MEKSVKYVEGGYFFLHICYSKLSHYDIMNAQMEDINSM